MSQYSQKLSPATKRILSQTPEDERSELSFLIRIDGELDEDRRSQLEPLVVDLRSVAGDIVVATAYPEAVPKLTALEFVKYVEASTPMFMEPAAPESQSQPWDITSDGTVQQDAPDPAWNADVGITMNAPSRKGEDCHEQD